MENPVSIEDPFLKNSKHLKQSTHFAPSDLSQTISSANKMAHEEDEIEFMRLKSNDSLLEPSRFRTGSPAHSKTDTQPE